ncbi:glycosyltransferase family 2 protein [Bernardetia sp. OM2101]|uniref:glycosyltransferase family 2 protein n=1 Tax=Bernardetia sp. OM2101 TaxID=3344876 RepID=UPI0035CFE667
MRVVGFSFIKNAVALDYPIVQAIESVLPLCDEFVIMVGNSDDDTLALIENLAQKTNKVKIYNSIWDDSLKQGGRVLAAETDKAYAKILENDKINGTKTDWAVYIQGDETVHEKYLSNIKDAMEKYKDDPKVEGLLLNYLHFYGSYDYVGDSRKWYRREIRVVKAREDIFSFRDAQGFRKKPNTILKVKHIDAYIYHYGWVRPPQKQLAKQKAFNSLYKDKEWVDNKFGAMQTFDYSGIDSLKKFEGTHPKVIQERIQKMNWTFEHDISKKNYTLRVRFLTWVEKWTGWRIGEYKNYKRI